VLILIAMLLGVGAVLLVPPEFVLVLVLAPFALCIFLGWYVAFQNKAVQFTPFRLFFWPWINVTAPFRSSMALLALYMSAGVAVGSCLAILVRVANA
jgi:hypothetical protein